jgi:signal transduction histidine kinase
MTELEHAVRLYSILIVDDEEGDRRLLTKLLANPAPDLCEVQCSPDGASGLAAMRLRAFDCVLLDFNLPDMTGLEFLAEAGGDQPLPSAIVLITGHGSEAVAVEAMKRGAQDYLVKDIVNERRLWRVIRGAVGQKELREQLDHSLEKLRATNAALEAEVAIRQAAEAELRSARDAAEQASRDKTHFVAMVTHELRTPLNGMLGYAQLLRIESGLSPQQEQRVEAMTQAGRHLLEMIERVLDFASIDSGRLELHPRRMRIDDVAADCITFIRPIAEAHGLTLRTILSPDTPDHIVADPGRLRQVLLNLLGNALKFTRDGGVELRVKPGSARGTVRFEIADTSPGLDDSSRARLFQDFSRLSALPSAEGAGLGLAIAARIVKMMGGNIGHAHQVPQGSIFWVELPGGLQARPPAADGAGAEVNGFAHRILLVDDIAMNRDVIGAFMRAAGFEAMLAENGEAAVQLAAEQKFDLILMDIRMPEMDGLEATRRIRALPAPHGRVPILGLSAYALLDQVAECRAAGMDGHLPKPVEYAALASTINETIARAQMVAEAEK